MKELHELSLKECQAGLGKKQFSAAELVESYLRRMEAYRDLNAYVLETAELAREQAKTADKRIAAGEARALEGIPLGVKDLYCTRGVRTTACSKMLADFVPPYESTVTGKLWNAGAILLGKLNMDEFAMGGTNTTSCFGAVKNYHDRTRVSGGSSGGSATATAASLAAATLGSETGDSIRMPSAVSGVVGFKPSYGRCSRYGMIGYSSSLDQAGPVTRTVEDAAILLNYMAGHDRKDAVCADIAVPDYTKTLKKDLKGIKVGIVKEYENRDVHPDVAKIYADCIDRMRRAGAEIKTVSMPDVVYAEQVYAVIANCEASSNMSRFDGVRFGRRGGRDGSLDEMYASARGEGFGWQVKRRLFLGTHLLSVEQYETYFLQAQRVRRKLCGQLNDAFRVVDVLFAPVVPDRPVTIQEAEQTGAATERSELSELFTDPMALAGVPCIAVPAGFAHGMPTGMQFAAARFNEAAVLSAGYALESLLKEGV